MPIKTLKWLSLSVVVALIGVISLSTYYYRTLETNPVAIWHGANLAARSLIVSGKRDPIIDIDDQVISRIGQLVENGQVPNAVDPYPESDSLSQHQSQTPKNIALLNTLDERLQHDLKRLDQVRQDVSGSKERLGSLRQDYASLAAHGQMEAVRNAQIQSAVDGDSALSRESHGESGEPGKGVLPQRKLEPIPRTVLDNVNKTTGISPEEISELLNR